MRAAKATGMTATQPTTRTHLPRATKASGCCHASHLAPPTVSSLSSGISDTKRAACRGVSSSRPERSGRTNEQTQWCCPPSSAAKILTGLMPSMGRQAGTMRQSTARSARQDKEGEESATYLLAMSGEMDVKSAQNSLEYT